MQINNNVQSPNFGMALKINPKAKGVLEEASMDVIDSIKKAGQDLKDTKFFHLKIDADGTPKIESDKDAYFGFFRKGEYSATKNGVHAVDGKTVPDKRIILIEKDGLGGHVAGVGRYVPYGETEPFYSAWGYAPFNRLERGDINMLSKIVKLLDDVAVEKYAQQTAEKAAEAQRVSAVKKGVSEILDLYSE